MPYGHHFIEFENQIAFENKKLMCCISGNKTSQIPGELYSERVKVIELFENSPNHIKEKFSLYGVGWQPKGYGVYKGAVESKAYTYDGYKFALSLENAQGLKGYVTEKIFDCFVAGIVPIYKGASNIDDLIPRECYIAYDDFPSIKDLIEYLEGMSKEQWQNYIVVAKRFIRSSSADYFRQEFIAKIILSILDKPRIKTKISFLDILLGRKSIRRTRVYYKFMKRRKNLKKYFFEKTKGMFLKI